MWLNSNFSTGKR